MTDKKKRRNSDIPPSLGEILDGIKKNVNQYTWGIDNPSDYKAMEILAEKLKKLKLI